jgi:membrane associated rhomboid family serine protease
MSITEIIIIVTILVSLSAFNNQKVMEDLIFYPPAISQRNQWYRVFTCGFIHADFGHLFFNMMSMYLFGKFVEHKFEEIFLGQGKLLYLIMYVLGLGASILPTYFKNRNNYHYRSLGASGAVSAVVFAGLLIAPSITVGFFIIPPIIPGFIFAPLYLLVSIWLDRKGGGNINHSAHIFGALFGILFVIIAGKLLADYNAISSFKEEVLLYMQFKGWLP